MGRMVAVSVLSAVLWQPLKHEHKGEIVVCSTNQATAPESNLLGIQCIIMPVTMYIHTSIYIYTVTETVCLESWRQGTREETFEGEVCRRTTGVVISWREWDGKK